MQDDPDFTTEPTAPFASFEEANRYLEVVSGRMGVNHLSYALMRFTKESQDTLAWVATYDPAYMSYYMEHYTQLGDQVIEDAFVCGEVMDWVETAAADPVSQELFSMAGRYGITKFGISIPLRDGETDNVLFSVSVKSAGADWHLLRGRLAERFRPLAGYFHRRVKPPIELRKAAELNSST